MPNRKEKTTDKRASKGTAKEKEPTIKLELLTELFASLLGNAHLFFGIRGVGDILIRINELAVNPKLYKAGVDRFESQMSTAIEVASWLGASVPAMSNRSAEKRIHNLYALLRAVFFEFPWPTNPRIDSTQKGLTHAQNQALIEMTLNLLRDVPCVKEAIEAQRTAKTFGRWKIEQRDKATNAYSKLRAKLLGRVDELKTYLSAKLLEPPVKTSKKYSGAKNTGILAPKTTSGAKNTGILAPKSKPKKGRRK